MIERPLAAAIRVHDLDAGVGGTHPAVRILTVEQLCAIGRERGERFAEIELEFWIDASGRDEVFGHSFSDRALVNQVRAIGGPAGSAHGSVHHVHDAEVRIPDLDAFLGGVGAADRIADSAAGQKLRRQLGLVGCGI